MLTHGPVVYPLTVTVLQASSQLPGQLAFVHVAVQVRQRVQHHDLQNTHSADQDEPFRARLTADGTTLYFRVRERENNFDDVVGDISVS